MVPFAGDDAFASAQRGRVRADVHGHKERFAAHHTHELAHWRVPLEVQAAGHVAHTAAVVELNERARQAEAGMRGELLARYTSMKKPRSSSKTSCSTTRTSGSEVWRTVNFMVVILGAVVRPGGPACRWTPVSAWRTCQAPETP